MEDKEVHNKEAIKIRVKATKEKIGQANGQWAELFHEQMFSILAPQGLEMRFVGGENKKVSKLYALTEARIKKSANVAHNLMKQYRQRFLRALVEEYVETTNRRAVLIELIQTERNRPWWSRHKKILAGYYLELSEIEIRQQTINGIEGLLQTVLPEDEVTDAMIEAGSEYINKMDEVKPGAFKDAIENQKEGKIVDFKHEA